MRNNILYSVLVFLFITSHSIAREPAQPNPKDFKITVEQVGDALLPYQAIRARVRLTNATGRRLESIPRLSGLPWIRRPMEERFVRPGWFMFPQGHDALVNVHLPSPQRMRDPWSLGPSESKSASVAFAADFPDVLLEHSHADPFFDSPGVYQLEFRYPYASVPTPYTHARLSVTVKEPQIADDVAILAILKEGRTLADFMMSSVHLPDREHARTLETIIRLSPDSSYTDYARYALARAYFDRFGETAPLGKENREWRANEIDKFVQTVHDVEIAAAIKILARFCFHSATFRDRSKHQCEKVFHLKGTKAHYVEQRAAIMKLVEAEEKECLEQRAEAIRLLESIKSPGFAYRPEMLVFLKEIYVYEICRHAAEIGLVSPVLQWRSRQALELALIHARAVKMSTVATKLSIVMDELCTKFPDALVWQYDDGWMSPDEWKSLKAKLQERPENIATTDE